MRWTRNARDNMLPAPLFQSTFAHGGKVGEGSSGHQCWLPLHSGSIPPPASHYLADREPLEPHLDELQPRGGGGFCCPPAGGNKTLFAGFHYRRRPTLSPLTHHRHQELEKLLKPRASTSSSAKKGPFLKSFLLIMSILHLVAFIRPSKTLFRSRYVYFYKTGLFQPQDHFNFSTQFSFPLQ